MKIPTKENILVRVFVSARHRIKRASTCLLVLSATLSSASVWSANWTVTPRLNVREIYSDNITLASNNEDPEFVTDVSPAISVDGDGGRVDLSVFYNLQALFFPSGDFDTELNHQLNAQSTTELIRKMVFLDVDGAISQSNADNTKRRASDNISRTGNVIDTYVFRVSPSLRNGFGSFAQSDLRYEFVEVINEGNTLDSKAHRVKLQVDSGARFSSVPWRLFGESRNVNFDDGTETEFWQMSGEMRYPASRAVSGFGRVGYEFQDFGTSRQDEKGTFWQAGATWAPSPRTTVDGGYGSRFFGDNFFFNISHNTRRTTLRVSFSEDVSFTNEVVASNVLSSIQIGIPTTQATPTSEVLVTERLDGSITFTGRRTNISLSGFHEDRDFQDTGDTETVFGVATSVSRNISPTTALLIGAKWEEIQFRDGVQEDTRWEGSASLNRNLGPKSDVLIEYKYTDQDSNVPTNEFRENRISIQLSLTF